MEIHQRKIKIMVNKNYLSVKDLATCGRYSIGEWQLRRLLFLRKKNGLAKCCRKISNRILIREDLFQDWLESHSEEKETN